MCHWRDRITTTIQNIEYDKRIIGEIVSTMKSSFNIFKRFNILPIDILEEHMEQKYFNDLELLWEFGLYDMINTIPNSTTRYQWDNMRGDLFYGISRIVNYHINSENFTTDIVNYISEFYNNIPTNFIVFGVNRDIENFQYCMLENNTVLPKQLQEDIKINFKTDIQTRLDKREEELEICREEINILDTMNSYELFPQNQEDYINDKIITQLKQTGFNGNFKTCIFAYSSDNYFKERLFNIKFCNKIVKFILENTKSQNKITYLYQFYGEYFNIGDDDNRIYIKKIYDEYEIYKQFELTTIPPPYAKFASIVSRY